MQEELVDIVDEHDKPTGEKVTKTKAHKEGLLHRSAHIWIYNSKGEILIQLRAKNKLLFPNRWDISAAGHVSAGEDPITSGLRELEEELGLKATEGDLEFLETHREEIKYEDIINNEYYYIYITKKDIDPKTLKLQTEEVAEIKFISIEELEKDLLEHPEKYVPTTWYWDFIIRKVKEKIH